MFRKKKHSLTWLPIILGMGAIFMFSSQSYQQQDIKPLLQLIKVPDSIKAVISTWQFPYDGQIVSAEKYGFYGFVEFILRKLAHIILYSFLGFFMVRAFWHASFWSKKLRVSVAIGIVIVYAVLDEIHQGFTAYRNASLTDVGLDAAGAVLGGGIYLLIQRSNKNVNNKRGVNQ